MTELTPVTKKFILHWGEMGTSWCINRTVAQIYAILYLSPTPITADQICESLGLARSTVSTGLHELMSWGVVRVVHELGDRRDHFETMNDVWDMFRAILSERKRREIDPTLSILRESVADLTQNENEDEYIQERLMEMLDFFEVVTTVYEQVEQLPTGTLKKMAHMGDNLTRVLNRLNQP
jgi:DNA-binding transcriptional regulator GbsR (MarR family)